MAEGEKKGKKEERKRLKGGVEGRMKERESGDNRRREKGRKKVGEMRGERENREQCRENKIYRTEWTIRGMTGVLESCCQNLLKFSQ